MLIFSLVNLFVVTQTVPWTQKWGTSFHGEIKSVHEYKGELLVSTDREIWTVRKSTGQKKLKYSFGSQAYDLRFAFHGDNIVASAKVPYGKAPVGIVCANLETGKVFWRLQTDSKQSEVAVDGNMLYTSTKDGYLSGINLLNQKTIWTKKLPAPPDESSWIKHLVVSKDHIVFDWDRDTFIWRKNNLETIYREKTYNFDIFPICLDNKLIIYVPDAIQCFDLSKGKVIWNLPSKNFPSYASVKGGFLYVNINGVFSKVSITTGNKIWSTTLSKSENFHRENFFVAEGINHWVGDNGLTEVTDDGVIRQILPLKDCFGLVSQSMDQLIVNNYHTLNSYSLESRHDDTAKEINRLADNVLHLDSLDLDYLRKRGADAVLPMLKAVVKASKNVDSETKRRNNLHKVVDALGPSFAQCDTDQLVSILNKLSLVSDEGMALCTQIFRYCEIERVKLLAKNRLQSGNNQYILNAILDSERQGLDAVCLEYLNSHNLNSKCFELALHASSMYGNPKALEKYNDFNKLQLKAEKISQIHENYRVKIVDKYKIGTRNYELVAFPLLRNRDDLWIHDCQSNEYIFTGVSSAHFPMADPTLRYDKERKITDQAKKSYKKYCASGWKKDLSRLSTLRLDSDHDGASNLVEKVFGTDPNVSDSDEDGIVDSDDAWPMLKDRPLTDNEMILKLAAESVNSRDQAVLMSYPEGVTPFPLSSNGGRGFVDNVSVRGGSHEGAIVSFCKKDSDPLNSGPFEPDWASQYIGFNPAKERASIVVRNDFYGDEVQLRKFNGRWYVTRRRMRWIS
jgi:outer membrane protein assembly factor BamB